MKKAFTMIELVLVIVVVGILSYVAASSFQRNKLREAADQLANHIRYTQHLAMSDDRFSDTNATWFASNWLLWVRIFNNNYYYEVFSDKDQNTNSDATEEAIDPQTGERLGNENVGVGLPTNKNLLLTTKYNITNISFSNNCKIGQGGKVAFDYLGRPYGDVSYAANDPFFKYLTQDCNITLVNGEGNITISVAPETGYGVN